MAQTFRTGTNDIDALDFVQMYLRDESQHQANLHDFNDLYVLVNFRPVVTKKNWRMDCGVAGYDNRLGLPPFFPTRLRFEDFIYRLWIQQPGIASAHVDAVQTHIKNNYMRNPLAMDVFNEEICTLLKKKIKDSVTKLEDLRFASTTTAKSRSRTRRRFSTRSPACIGRSSKPLEERRMRSGARRSPCSPRISPARSTDSSPTSSSRTSPASSMMSSA